MPSVLPHGLGTSPSKCWYSKHPLRSTFPVHKELKGSSLKSYYQNFFLKYLIKSRSSPPFKKYNFMGFFGGLGRGEWMRGRQIFCFTEVYLSYSNMHCKCKSKKKKEPWLYRYFHKVMPFSTQEITWKMKPNTDASQLIRMTSIIQKHEETQEEVPLDSKRCNVLFIQFEHLTPAHGSLQEWTEAGNAAWGTRWPSCILPSMRGQCLHTSQTEVALTDLPAAPSLNKGSHSCPLLTGQKIISYF